MSSTATVKKTAAKTRNEGVRTRSSSRASKKIEEASADQTITVDQGRTLGVEPRGEGTPGEEPAKKASEGAGESAWKVPSGIRQETLSLKKRVESARNTLTSQGSSGFTSQPRDLSIEPQPARASILSRLGLDYRVGTAARQPENEGSEYDDILPPDLTGSRNKQRTEDEPPRGRGLSRGTILEPDDTALEQYYTTMEDPEDNPERFEEGTSYEETRGSEVAEQEELEAIQRENNSLKKRQEEAARRLLKAKGELEEESNRRRAYIQLQKEKALDEQRRMRNQIDRWDREARESREEARKLEQERVREETISPKRPIRPETPEPEENRTVIDTWLGRPRNRRQETPGPSGGFGGSGREYRSEERSEMPEEPKEEPPEEPDLQEENVPTGGNGGDDGGDDDGDDGDENPDAEADIPNNRRNQPPQKVYIQSSTLKLPQPKNFNGTKPKVAEWLFSLETYYEASGTAPDKRVAYAAMLLSDNALVWWMAIRKEGRHPNTWREFSRQIQQQFKTIDEDVKARRLLYKLTQMKSVQDYIAEFTRLSFLIPDLAETEKFHRFKEGLKPEIRNEMDKRGITTNLTNLQTQAQKYDEILFSQRERPTFDKNFKKKKFYEIEKKPEVKQVKEIKQVKPNFKKEVTCYNCQKKGHMAKECRSPKKANNFKRQEGNNRQINRIQLGMISIEYIKKTNLSKTPVYQTPGSAGADLWPAADTTIERFETKIVHTGIAMEIPEGYHGQIHTRSSFRMKGIEISGIIDSDYRGTIGLVVKNTNPYPIDILAEGKAIAQLILVPNIQAKFKETRFLTQTQRKGGFGSTDKKMYACSTGSNRLVISLDINNHQTKALIDSGADGNFIGEKERRRLRLGKTKLENPILVTLPDDDEYVINHQVQDAEVEIQGFKQRMDMYILPMDIQVILGNPWLTQINPHINWKDRTMMIQGPDKIYTIQADNKEPVKKKLDFITIQSERCQDRRRRHHLYHQQTRRYPGRTWDR